MQVGAASPQLSQPAFQIFHFLQFKGEKDGSGYICSLGVKLLDERSHKFPFILFLRAVQQEVIAPYHLAAPDIEDLHAGEVAYPSVAKIILILRVIRHDLLPFRHFADGLNLVPDPGRFLVLKFIRGFLHLGCQFRDNVIHLSLQKGNHFINHSAVCVHRNKPSTGSFTPSQVIIQARPI